MNIIRFIITIVAPVGTSNKNDTIRPIMNAITDIIILDITTLLNLLNTCIDDSVGKIIKLDINNEPISLIPNTIVIEHKIAKIMLYRFVLIPIDLENLSSNVIANILLYEKIYNKTTINDKTIQRMISLSPIDKMLPNK